MNRRISYILLVIYIVTLTGCQTMKTMVEHPDYNIFDSFQSSAAYDSNKPFPKKGYSLRGLRYKNIVVNKFNDNDTVYYIKYTTGFDESRFYFTFINKKTADIIIANSRDKNVNPNRYEREKWLDNTLVRMGIQDRNNKTSLWTYFEPKRKIVRGNLPTDAVRTGYHYEYEKFNYTTANKKFNEKLNPELKHYGMTLLGQLWIMSMLTNNKQKENEYKTQWDILNNAQKAVIHEHDNAK